MSYFFILGRNQTLSIAEIANLHEFRHEFHESRIVELSPEALVLETEEKLDCQNLQKQLGGTIKIGVIIGRIDANLTQISANDFLKELPHSKRVYFGFSLYKLDNSVNLKQFLPQIKKIAIKIKKELKESGVSSRWVVSKERTLSSVVVQKNKLLTSGAEFCLFIKTRINADRDADQRGFIRGPGNQCESVYLGKTLSVQEFEEYSQRDYGRPVRPIGQGLIPPKLAKIMINLAGLSRDKIILDPFLGSGTILQEAVLLGYKNIIGTDIDEGAIDNARQNLEWLIERSKIKNQSTQINLSARPSTKNLCSGKIPKTQIKNIKTFRCDARELSREIPKNSIDAIITEPYLGPSKVTISNLSLIIDRLSGLYLDTLREFKKVLKPDGRIVIVFPVFKIRNQKYFLPILQEIKKIGWRIQPILPEELKKYPFIQITPRQSIIYSRPDQIVLREILIFRL